MNPYEQQREDRIRRNNAMLEKLQLRQRADKLAAPVQAAAEAEAKRQADIRVKIAAVEPRQRSKRGSAAQAKAALSKQALAMSSISGDCTDDSGNSLEAEDLSDDGMSSARGKKRKADADEEDDYDPLEDHLDVQNADGSASDAEDYSAASSDAPESDVDPTPKQSSCRGQRHRDNSSATGQRGSRGKKAAHAMGQKFGSEEDDFELQQALAMSLLDRQQPAAQSSCPEVPVPAQPPTASAHAGLAAEHSAAALEEPCTATLREEHIKAATTKSGLMVEHGQSSGAAAASKADVAQDTAPAAQAGVQGNKNPRAQAGSGQKSRKQPAKGKALKLRDPADIGRAYDIICGGTVTIREHHLQQVWSDMRGGNLDKLACNNMLTYAADTTGEAQLDRAAFIKLCQHFM